MDDGTGCRGKVEQGSFSERNHWENSARVKQGDDGHSGGDGDLNWMMDEVMPAAFQRDRCARLYFRVHGCLLSGRLAVGCTLGGENLTDPAVTGTRKSTRYLITYYLRYP